MKRAILAACFSVAFSTMSASLYYAVAFTLMAHHFSPRGFAGSLAAAGITAFSVAGPFSFCFGFLGGWILPKLPFVATRTRLISAGILLRGILGCMFPVLLTRGEGGSDFASDFALTWPPALLIGASCAGSWAWFWSPLSQGNSAARDSAPKGDG